MRSYQQPGRILRRRTAGRPKRPWLSVYTCCTGPFIHTHALSCALLATDLNSDAVKDNILKVEGPDWTFEAKAKAVEHTTIAEIKICNTSGSLTG